ncbi:MAG: FHA domain-containing protein [Thermoplasmatota archaeon]
MSEGNPAQPFDARSLAADLDALSNEQRLDLLTKLTRPMYGEEIAEALGVSRQAASRHIERLLERGFVRAMHGRRSTGPVVEYAVVPARLFALGMRLADMARLEPSGGPAVRPTPEPTLRKVVAGVASMGAGSDRQEIASAPPTAAATLLVLTGPAAGVRIDLPMGKSRWTIGRADDRDVRIEKDPFVSSRHAEIRMAPNGYDVVDAGSANGSTLNLVRLPAQAPVPIKVGDVIGVGHTLLAFQRLDGAAGA